METTRLFLPVRKKQAERFLDRYAEPNGQESLNQFIQLPFSLLDNPSFRNRLLKKKRFRTYLWLRRYIVRGPNLNDPSDVYWNYWMNGKLAVSIKMDKIARDLGFSKSTASDHIRQLEEDGIIIVDEVPACDASDGRMHLVFILGTCTNGREKWFIDDVFNSPKQNLI